MIVIWDGASPYVHCRILVNTSRKPASGTMAPPSVKPTATITEVGQRLQFFTLFMLILCRPCLLAKFHTSITGLLQHWKCSDSTPVEFSVPALWYSSECQVIPSKDCEPSKSDRNVFLVMRKLEESKKEHQCAVRLKSETICEWLRGEWTAEIEASQFTTFSSKSRVES